MRFIVPKQVQHENGSWHWLLPDSRGYWACRDKGCPVAFSPEQITALEAADGEMLDIPGAPEPLPTSPR